MSTPATDAPEIRLVRGSVRLNGACYERYFGGTHSIILLYEAGDRRLWVLPVRSARAGGFLLKQVNLQGDRVVATHGFFRDHGIPEDLEAIFTPRWDTARQGLALDLDESTKRHEETRIA
jgi:hypothetical protein